MAKHLMEETSDASDFDRLAKRSRSDSDQASQRITASLPTPGVKLASTEVEATTMIDLDKSDIVKQTEVGICAFVRSSSTPQLRGLLKKRYTDFLVNEILLDGTVLHLKSLKPKPLNKPRPAQSDTEPQAKAATTSNQHAQKLEGNGPQNQTSNEEVNGAKEAEDQAPPSTEEDLRATQVTKFVAARDVLIAYFPLGVVVDLLKMDALIQSVGRKPKIEPIKVGVTSNRSVRAEMHGNIRRIFSGRIDSSTDERSVLTVWPASASRQQPSGSSNSHQHNDHRESGKLTWEDKGGEYLHFTLYKENKDTMEVMSFLSYQLHIKPKVLQFAGTKDRRAATVQRISGYKIDAMRAAGLNKVLRGSAVGDFSYEKAGLELGRDCGGNEFTVTLRECEVSGTDDLTDDDKLKKAKKIAGEAMTSLREQGFLNYYGLQRFGTFRTRTDLIGCSILQGDFEGAIDDILEYDRDIGLSSLQSRDSSDSPSTAHPDHKPDRISTEDRHRAEALYTFYKHRRDTNLYPFDPSATKKILNRLPRKFTAESNVIRHLSKNPNDHYGALMMIPRNLRMMYVHAYQSLVWNEAVNERWRKWGAEVVEGDLVLVEEHKDKEQQREAADTADVSQKLEGNAADGAPGQQQETDADGELVIHAQPSDPDNDDPNTADAEDPFSHTRARSLTSSEATSGQYNIFDIVLPLPGYDVSYSANALGEWYTEFMASERGGGLDPNDMRRKQREFSLSGGYRKCFGRIGESWEVDVKLYGGEGEEQFVVTDLERIRAEEDQRRPQPQQEGNGAGMLNKQDGGDGAIDENKKIEGKTEGANANADAAISLADEIDGNAAEFIPKEQEETEGQAEAVGKKLAIILKFQLGTSQYATMALRELSGGGIVAFKPEFSGGR